MSNFAVDYFEPVMRNGKVRFYKLLEDGSAQIDAFYEEITKNERLKKEFNEIVSCMNYVAESNAILPKKKLNSIKDGKKEIALEFKKDILRVYCFKKEMDFFIVMGGYKKDQKKDIEGLKRMLKDDENLVGYLQQLTKN